MKQFGKTFLATLGIGAPTTTQDNKLLLERVCNYLERGMVVAGGLTSFAFSGINIHDALLPFLPNWAVWVCTGVGSVSCFFLIDLALGVIAPVVIKDLVTGGFRKNNAKALATLALGCIAAGQVITTTSWSAQGGYLLAEKMVEKPTMFVSSNKTQFSAMATPYDNDIATMQDQEQKIKDAIIKTASELAQTKRAPAIAEWGYRAKKKNAEAISQINNAYKEAAKDSAAYVAKNYKPNKQLEEYRAQKAKFLSIKTEDDSKDADQNREKEKISVVEYNKKKEFIQGLIGELGQYSTYFFLLICTARICTQQGDASSYRGIRIWPFSWISDRFAKKKRINSSETSETGHFDDETNPTFSPPMSAAKVKNKDGEEEMRDMDYGTAKRKVQQYIPKLKTFTGNPTTNVRNIVEYYRVMQDLDAMPAQEFLDSVLNDTDIPAGMINLLKQTLSNEGLI